MSCSLMWVLSFPSWMKYNLDLLRNSLTLFLFKKTGYLMILLFPVSLIIDGCMLPETHHVRLLVCFAEVVFLFSFMKTMRPFLLLNPHHFLFLQRIKLLKLCKFAYIFETLPVLQLLILLMSMSRPSLPWLKIFASSVLILTPSFPNFWKCLKLISLAILL